MSSLLSLTIDNLPALNVAFQGRAPAAVLRYVARACRSKVALACAFNLEDCLLYSQLAGLGEQASQVGVFTLDTGLFFPETRVLWRALEERYSLPIKAVSPKLSVAQQAAEHGAELWTREPGRCCAMRKVAPLEHKLGQLDAWISGIRRDQTPERATAELFEWDARFGLFKINPLVHWSEQDVWRAVRSDAVPYNALLDRGYRSVGCWPCSSVSAEGEDPRAGRWRGKAKTECGLHALDGAGKPNASAATHTRKENAL